MIYNYCDDDLFLHDCLDCGADDFDIDAAVVEGRNKADSLEDTQVEGKTLEVVANRRCCLVGTCLVDAAVAAYEVELLP